MIITRLIGGLGNQMFQYAAAKSLALKHNTNVLVDVTELNKDTQGLHTKREYDLHIFNSNINIASEKELNKVNQLQLLPLIIKKIFNIYYIANEEGTEYQSKFIKFPKNTYLNGFWQSELYFIDFENEIKKDFQFIDKIIHENKTLATEISNSESVALHVRRGDYVSNSNANQFHGLCSIDYYEQAVNIISQKFQNFKLFVFSDDIDWCKEHLKFEAPIYYVETNSAYSDLYLMSICKHNIIANSSFSWWGAWLNNNIDKTVVAPNLWFASKEVNTSNLIPKNWIKL